jgi:Asp-tRNA(Asn)/Glu-tRNA(Gln) amidotransferase B subunit
LGYRNDSAEKMFTYFKDYIKKKSDLKLINNWWISEKQGQAKLKTSSLKKMKIWTEVNEIETKNIQRCNETKIWFFEKIDKNVKPHSQKN